MKRILLLGAGRVGAAMARDLAGEFELTVADASQSSLARLGDGGRMRRVQVDVGDARALEPLLRDADLVVGAVPGPLGFETLRRVLEAGRHVVDISFFEQDAFELDELARAQGCIAIVDCGVAPGCSNLLLGRHAAEMDVRRFWCAVGGLPVVRTWPFEYKAPFSPIDVIAEYTRPARFRRGGADITLPALSEIEAVEIPGVGTLEAFNTDGLRTLLRTTPVPDMVEKTLRYPGHAERMRLLRETGFFSETALPLADGSAVRPLDVSASLLFAAWRYEEGEADQTAMRVVIEGEADGRVVTHTYDLLDRYDAETGTSSMARTTGYTCTAAVRLVAGGHWTEAGITPPELLGRERRTADFILADLHRHGVTFSHRTT